MADLPARTDDLPHGAVPVPDRRRPARRARPTRSGERLAARTWLGSLALLFAACTATPTSPTAPPSASANTIAMGGTVRVAQSSDIQSLDPWTATDDATITALRQVYEGLVELEPGGFRIVAKLAETWSASADGKVWTFRLRSGVRFHDGSTFDAQSVLLNFERAKGFARFDVGTIVTTIDAPDASTVVFTLASSYAPFLATLASGSFGIVNPICFRQGPVWSTAASQCAQGTGPCRIAPGAWRPGESLTLQRNPTYWSRDADGRTSPYVDTLVFRAIRGDTARVAELRSAGVSVSLDI